MSDPQKYRTKEEVDEFKGQDPIDTTLDYIKKNNILTEDEIKTIQKKVKDKMEECVKFAEESPEPDPSEIYEDVYFEPDYPFVKD